MTFLQRAKRAGLVLTLALPGRVRGALFGPAPVNDRGVALDAQVHAMLALERRVGAKIAKGEVGEARAGMLDSVALVEPAERPVDCVEDIEIAGVRCRRYKPAEELPVLVYLHGGGHTVGDLRSHDRLCRRLALEADVEVVSVDYRLAPEHPYPAGLDDVLAVVRALRVEVPILVLAGDSAGGNLTAACCLALRDEGEAQPDLQLLIYPGTDMTGSMESRGLFGSGYLLEADAMAWYQDQYAPSDLTDPLVSPLFGEHHGLPPAIVSTAGFDPLRDEGEALAEKLRAAGVEVVELRAADQVHGFVNMDGVIRGADAAIAAILAALRIRLDALRAAQL